MTEDYSYLPKLLGEIAAVAGHEPALFIARAREGNRASFPLSAQVTRGNWLHELVKHDAASNIAE